MKYTNDSDVLANKIKQLTIFINNISNNTKGKNERYQIEDEIITIKKLLKTEFNNINKSKYEKADKISMQSSIREMNGYFGTLIKTLSNKANVVNDLTLSQFLKQQSKRLNSWKLSEFLVTDSIHDNWTEAYSDTGSWADDADLLKEDDFKEPDMRDWWVKELNKLKNQSTKLSRQRQALKLMSYLDDFKNNSVEREIHTFLSTIIHAYDSYFFEA